MTSYAKQTWAAGSAGGTPLSPGRLNHIEDGIAGKRDADVVAPAATGVASTDTAALQAAIDATPVGGSLFIPSGGYKINAALSVTKHISLIGSSARPFYRSTTVAGAIPNQPTVAPYLTGTVIEQTVAATNILDLTGAGTSPVLRDLGLMFTAGLASTGHGVNASPTQTYGGSGGHDIGLYDFLFDNVHVLGHDGNHYAFVFLNPLQGTLNHCRSYGGGGFWIGTDVGCINAGNMVLVNPYVSYSATGGTAVGFGMSAAANSTPGSLNLIVYVRPQCQVNGAGIGTATGWSDLLGAGYPTGVNVVAPDLEGAGVGHTPKFGKETQIIGSAYVSSAAVYDASVRLGKQAGASMVDTGGVTAVGAFALALATGNNNTALGYGAFQSLVSGSGATGVGSGAGQNQTGGNNTAVGVNALQGVSGSSTGTFNTALGFQALQALTTGLNNAANGANAGLSLTTGSANTFVGKDSGYFTNASTANAIVGGSNNTFLGYTAGSYSGSISQATAVGSGALVGAGATALGYLAKAQTNNAVAVGASSVASSNPSLALGYSTTASASGAVAIGTDSGGAGASSAVSNVIALGTANHKVRISNNSTGAGSAALGANCPAVTATAPYTWFTMVSSDGSTVYVPAWK